MTDCPYCTVSYHCATLKLLGSEVSDTSTYALPGTPGSATATERLAEYDRLLTGVMPSDFAMWTDGCRDDWPLVAALKIKTLSQACTDSKAKLEQERSDHAEDVRMLGVSWQRACALLRRALKPHPTPADAAQWEAEALDYCARDPR